MNKEEIIEAMIDFLVDEGYLEEEQLNEVSKAKLQKYDDAARRSIDDLRWASYGEYTGPDRDWEKTPDSEKAAKKLDSREKMLALAKAKKNKSGSTAPHYTPKATAKVRATNENEHVAEGKDEGKPGKLEVEQIDEASVKDATGTVVGTHKAGEGFKPNALGKKLGHKAHPTDVPKGTTITKRGRPVGAKSFGASKRRDQTADEAGAHSEKPSFTDEIANAGKKIAKDADEWAYWRKQVNDALTPMELLELKVLDLDEAFEKGYVTGEEYFKVLGKAFEYSTLS